MFTRLLLVALCGLGLTANAAKAEETRIQAYTTFYTWHDNTPPGSADIAFAKEYGFPTLHDKAGGTGTYEDPITIAVGHVIKKGKSTPDFPAGTRIYIPNLKRYFMVEDVCGDGPKPQNGPCHTGYPAGTKVWVDAWMDGRTGNKNEVNACASTLTDTNGVAHLIIVNPVPDYSVVPGALFNNGTCTEQYGNKPVS